ncbi:antirestriction protein [Candidatus Vondammii sp. HM_W22]|uniref:antirestriction protein n=1 Tax=Candidatus Vondammii sp. HM_W22 TaxID=2687299 RepID=UPI002E7B5283|nr:antirestriction protein [Candidatus Vondammii sp. HM_W22]
MVTSEVISENFSDALFKDIFADRANLSRLTIMGVVEEFCPAYSFGRWVYYKLSNGGFFMAPDATILLQLVRVDCFLKASLSAEAAGIIASMEAYGRLGFATGDLLYQTQRDRLREFYFPLAEASLINRATSF